MSFGIFLTIYIFFFGRTYYWWKQLLKRYIFFLPKFSITLLCQNAATGYRPVYQVKSSRIPSKLLKVAMSNLLARPPYLPAPIVVTWQPTLCTCTNSSFASSPQPSCSWRHTGCHAWDRRVRFHVTCHISQVTCQMSCFTSPNCNVTSHKSYVMCHMSHITSHN